MRLLIRWGLTECMFVYFISQDALTSRKFCPVGRVIPGVQIVILDEDMKPQPVGSSGEVSFREH